MTENKIQQWQKSEQNVPLFVFSVIIDQRNQDKTKTSDNGKESVKIKKDSTERLMNIYFHCFYPIKC